MFLVPSVADGPRPIFGRQQPTKFVSQLVSRHCTWPSERHQPAGYAARAVVIALPRLP